LTLKHIDISTVFWTKSFVFLFPSRLCSVHAFVFPKPGMSVRIVGLQKETEKMNKKILVKNILKSFSDSPLTVSTSDLLL